MKRLFACLVLLSAVLIAGEAHSHQEREQRASLQAPRPLALPAQQRQAQTPSATPQIACREGSNPEPGMQGRVPREAVDSGRADEGYWCNLTVLGHQGRTGGFRVHRYIDREGRECAYYDTALLFPTNALNLSLEPTGVAVLDMSDPANPRRVNTLLTPAMQTPHESVNISVQRGVLAAVLGNPAAYPGGIDVYDISQDCRNPELMAAAFPASPFGHESGMAPDGLTFYPTSIGTGDTVAVDISNMRLPRTLWNGAYNTHGMSVSDDGTRGYLATGDGLVIVDLSEVQARKENPQVREISRLTWPHMTIPQVAIPVTIKGKPYVVEVDEYSSDGGGGAGAHGDVVGAARIIDVSDETAPEVVSDIRLDVHQPENRDAIAGDYGAQSPVQGYAAHYCNVPRREEPGIFACSMILSGLRVFDIRDPRKPKEIAYHVAPASMVSETGSLVIDERANFAMSQPAFAPERGEIWYSNGTSGFYSLRMDPEIWPFPKDTGPGGCVANNGFRTVGARRGRGGLRIQIARRRELPVRVDVYRAAIGRRIVAQRVGRFDDRTGSFTFRRRLRPGIYVVRARMLDGKRVFDQRHVVFERKRSGAIRSRPTHQRRDTCGLLRSFRLARPVFGGKGNVPLRISYRLTTDADVTVSITRRGKTVRRITRRDRTPGRTFRVSVPAKGLARGDYSIRLQAAGVDEQIAATVVARRL